MRYSRKIWIGIGMLPVIMLAVLFLGRGRSRTWKSQPPWFNRGGNLAPIPYKVVIGPVDVNRGVLGLLEPGMTRSQVRQRLGSPLVAGLRPGAAPNDAIPDASDASEDFYSGLFAWVGYGEGDRVISINFDLLAFSEKFRGDQQVLLAYRGKTYLLRKDLTQKDVMRGLRQNFPNLTVRVQSDDLILVGTGTSLSFTAPKGRLRSLFIIAQ